MTEREKAIEIIEKLDEYARSQSSYEYGLPVSAGRYETMIDIILDITNPRPKE